MDQETIFKKIYNVELNQDKYDIVIGKGLLETAVLEALEKRTKNKNVVFVFDVFFQDRSNAFIDFLSKAGYKVYPYYMVAGKHNKTISEAIKIYEILEANSLSRDSTIVALGGGVLGDLAGFVASTYHRGMKLINIPTTLTAMIDSSIGGKVAINFRKTINAIGNYYHPIANVIDFKFISTLPQRDFKAGLAEIIKCAIINDKELFDYLKSNSQKILDRDEDSLFNIMCRAIEIKLVHVSGDVKEKNERLKLNYGHTLGHSIEISTDVLEEIYRHGEGVSLGMVAAAFLARKYFGQGQDILDAHEEILNQYGLPTRVHAKDIGFEYKSLIEECMRNVHKDKKKKDNKLRFILPDEIGKCQVYDRVADDAIREAFVYLIKE
ncbi:MAG: 3-dehydroquinate synthase [Candidatus Omnitrophica bacterium]|nr:3-dehydroquinate synthase [Candidatus Omnitrophota bacterium]